MIPATQLRAATNNSDTFSKGCVQSHPENPLSFQHLQNLKIMILNLVALLHLDKLALTFKINTILGVPLPVYSTGQQVIFSIVDQIDMVKPKPL